MSAHPSAFAAYLVIFIDPLGVVVNAGVYSEPRPTHKTGIIPIVLVTFVGASYEEASHHLKQWARENYNALRSGDIPSFKDRL